jgi:hypothetical protein
MGIDSNSRARCISCRLPSSYEILLHMLRSLNSIKGRWQDTEYH